MMLTIGAVLLVLITVVVVILSFRVQGFRMNLNFGDNNLPTGKEKLPEDNDQKYLR